MTAKDFTMTLLGNKSPEEVFDAIINVREWWSGFYEESFEGPTEKLHDEFAFHAGNGAHYSKQKLIEVVPNQRIVWLITDSSLTFIEKTDEWVGTRVIFEISQAGDKTQLTFTHQGLTPEIECYDSCAPAWTQYLISKLTPMINHKV